VYTGRVVIAVVTLGIVLLTPRQFPVADEAREAMAAGDGREAGPQHLQAS
jgi:hypothetical protein